MHFIFKQLFNIFDVCGDWRMAGIQRKGTVEFEKLRFRVHFRKKGAVLLVFEMCNRLS